MKGKTLEQVYKSDPSYVDWCLREIEYFAINWNTFNQLKMIQTKWFLSKNACESIISDIKMKNYSFIDDFSKHEFNQWRKNQHDVLRYRDDFDASRILDLADEIGCEPEDLIANLDM